MHFGTPCRKIGVSAVSAVPSVYYRLSEASIEKHWDTIMDSTELPFFIYNIPQLTGYDLSFELLKNGKERKGYRHKKLLGKHLPDGEIQKIAGPDFVIFNGPDEQLLAGRLMGATAGIGGTYGTMPELYLELTRLIETGDIENAKKCRQNKRLHLRAFVIRLSVRSVQSGYDSQVRHRLRYSEASDASRKQGRPENQGSG